jgi:hypothetical protein
LNFIPGAHLSASLTSLSCAALLYGAARQAPPPFSATHVRGLVPSSSTTRPSAPSRTPALLNHVPSQAPLSSPIFHLSLLSLWPTEAAGGSTTASPWCTLPSMSESAADFPSSPRRRFADFEHRRPPAIAELRRIAAALPCFRWQPPTHVPSPSSQPCLIVHLPLLLTVLWEPPGASTATVGAHHQPNFAMLPSSTAPPLTVPHGEPLPLSHCPACSPLPTCALAVGRSTPRRLSRWQRPRRHRRTDRGDRPGGVPCAPHWLGPVTGPTLFSVFHFPKFCFRFKFLGNSLKILKFVERCLNIRKIQNNFLYNPFE